MEEELELESKEYQGLHTSTVDHINSILSQRVINDAEYTWLGPGKYFYEEGDTIPKTCMLSGMDSAYKFNPKRFKGKDRGILIVDLKLNENLNLIDNTLHKYAYSETIDHIREDLGKKNKKVDDDLLHLAALKIMKNLYQFTSVRAFVKREKRGLIQILESIILCVQENKEISNIKLKEWCT